MVEDGNSAMTRSTVGFELNEVKWISSAWITLASLSVDEWRGILRSSAATCELRGGVFRRRGFVGDDAQVAGDECRSFF